MRTPCLVPATVIVAALLAGCSPPVPAQRACTKIGCEDGLAVVVEGRPQGSYRVEARAAGEATRARQCPSPADCGHIFFPGFLPAEVTVEVIAGAATSSRTVRPAVETVQPNGPGCPPTCRQARVTVPWPRDEAGGAANRRAVAGGAAATAGSGPSLVVEEESRAVRHMIVEA